MSIIGAYMRTNGDDGRAQHRAGSLRALSHSANIHIDVSLMSPTRRRPAPIAGRGASRPTSSASGCSTWRRRSRPRPRRVPPPQSRRRSRDAVPARDRRAARRSERKPTAATMRSTLDSLPRRDRLDREGGAPGQADRRPLSRHRRSAAISKAAVRPARERAHRARCRRQGRRSMSARRRSGRGSRPSSRRSPPTRSNCRWSASRRAPRLDRSRDARATAPTARARS